MSLSSCSSTSTYTCTLLNQTMSFSFRLTPLTSPPQTHLRFALVRPKTPLTISASPPRFRNLDLPTIRCVHESSDHHMPVAVTPAKPRWENMLSTAASLYPVYVTVGGVIACLKPSTFAWFVNRAPFSYTLSLGLIMLAMGLTLELKDLLGLFRQRPLSCCNFRCLRHSVFLNCNAVLSFVVEAETAFTWSFRLLNFNWKPIETEWVYLILFGCIAQYTIMPAFGVIISKSLGLPPSLSVGLILLSCCPGGTASNVVTLIAQGDVPLSIVMTMCTTLGAVLLTPLLTKILAGTYVPVDAVKLSMSTLQVVVAPVLLGSYMQSVFPAAVKVVTPFAPLFAVLASSLLACSVFSENVVRLKSSMVGAPLASDVSPIMRIQSFLYGDLGVVILSVLLLHFAGFFVGYLSAAICGFKERQRRAISIEVGMQNSSLGVVLATTHFASSMVALPPAMSAVIMNIMGSSLGFFWRYINPSDLKSSPETVEKLK
ncbi:hypothetical protein JRO89_XS02G0242000 [Xanthoceras sorbifolium]|uniref:Sodium/metabolite cotransporter BASS1, chloroplastic n=1 Tax=Xanthoceras sorbifolium TaxID=99658 RepID=A0ABQ8IGS3_9ROSI|nr:hypothetical protein JRO89_XS02G0242000 [Xanthoceras sorbifolium]